MMPILNKPTFENEYPDGEGSNALPIAFVKVIDDN
jgi:hypothetical protein